MSWRKAFLIVLVLSQCNGRGEGYMKEIQLTKGRYGHTLNSAQVFSSDDEWIFYDTRNDDTHIARTGSIEKVNVNTGDIVVVYRTGNQTINGPGVGAVACHPKNGKIIFIHGLQNCDAQHPYGFTRRFGAIVDTNSGVFTHAEARCVRYPLVAGALRGGTHAHTWSGDGEWISFTYNDFLMESLQKVTDGKVADLRTIGVMAPANRVRISWEDEESFSGEYFSVVAATVRENPTPGSDEIDRAFDECWIGTNGYLRSNGTQQKRAIAFQGNVRSNDSTTITEVFVSDIPDDITRARTDNPVQGTDGTRPNVPAELVQRRLTFTSDRNFPGIQGPRYRLRTSPDGNLIYFLMKDSSGVVQLFSIPTVGGTERQLTHLEFPIQSQYNMSPDGNMLSVVADNSIWTVEAANGVATRITARSDDNNAPVGGVLWSRNGELLAYNRYVESSSGRYLQIFTIHLP
jgi:hypothetical protein